MLIEVGVCTRSTMLSMHSHGSFRVVLMQIGIYTKEIVVVYVVLVGSVDGSDDGMKFIVRWL